MIAFARCLSKMGWQSLSEGRAYLLRHINKAGSASCEASAAPFLGVLVVLLVAPDAFELDVGADARSELCDEPLAADSATDGVLLLPFLAMTAQDSL
jgi:hypothetical protein